MLGAIVDFGPKFFYFKLTGPRDTVGLWTASFEQFIEGIKKTDPEPCDAFDIYHPHKRYYTKSVAINME